MILGSNIYRLISKLDCGGGPGGGGGGDPDADMGFGTPGSAVTTGSNTTADGSQADGSTTVSGAGTFNGQTGYEALPIPDFASDFSGLQGEAPISADLASSALSELSDRGKLNADKDLTNSLGKAVASNNSFSDSRGIMSSVLSDNSKSTDIPLIGKVTSADVVKGAFNFASPIPMASQMAQEFGLTMAALTGVIVGDSDPGMTTGGPDTPETTGNVVASSPPTIATPSVTQPGPGILTDPAEIKNNVNAILRSKQYV